MNIGRVQYVTHWPHSRAACIPALSTPERRHTQAAVLSPAVVFADCGGVPSRQLCFQFACDHAKEGTHGRRVSASIRSTASASRILDDARTRGCVVGPYWAELKKSASIDPLLAYQRAMATPVYTGEPPITDGLLQCGSQQVRARFGHYASAAADRSLHDGAATRTGNAG
jgi:hypothetical protein